MSTLLNRHNLALRFATSTLFFCGAILSFFMPTCFGQEKAPASNEQTAVSLKSYVETHDPSFRWEKKETGEVAGCRWTRLHMVSQTWKDINWKHVVWILVPRNVSKQSEHAVLMISGGRWRDEWPADGPAQLKAGGEASIMATVAQALACPVVIVQQVPFQPIFGGMVEDEIISTTFEKFLRTGDPTWPLLFPMVKAAVRSMDAASDFLEKEENIHLKKFTVTGASKRGWTTWLTAATDARVDALAPMVIDVLNMPEQMKHQLATWGKYSEQIEDYSSRGIQRYMDTPVGKKLTSLVDPFAYRENIDQPKVLIFGTNDRYWPVDACGLYWNELKGEKYLLYVPNQGHGIQDVERLVGTVVALQKSRMGGKALPKFTWEFADADKAATLKVNVEQPVKEVRAWVAESDSRDFRSSNWKSETLTASGNTFEFKREKGSKNFAMFAEVVSEQEPFDCYLSTNLKVFMAPENGGN